MSVHKIDVSKEFAEEIAHGIARKIAIGIAFLFAFVFFVIFGGVVVQWLWNWLVTDLFGLRRLTIWEALGLLALTRILFGGWGRGGGSPHRSERKDWWQRRQKKTSRRGDAGAPSPEPASRDGIE